MNSIDRLALANMDAAQALRANQLRYDTVAAELLLRNTVVMVDNLQAEEFFGLPEEAEKAALEAAELASGLAPLTEEELMPLPEEPGDDFHYRTGVRQPLHSLQKKLIIDFNNRAFFCSYEYCRKS